MLFTFTEMALAMVVTAVMGSLAGAGVMAMMIRRQMREEHARLRECLDRGNRLVDTNEDVIRRLRNTL